MRLRRHLRWSATPAAPKTRTAAGVKRFGAPGVVPASAAGGVQRNDQRQGSKISPRTSCAARRRHAAGHRPSALRRRDARCCKSLLLLQRTCRLGCRAPGGQLRRQQGAREFADEFLDYQRGGGDPWRRCSAERTTRRATAHARGLRKSWKLKPGGAVPGARRGWPRLTSPTARSGLHAGSRRATGGRVGPKRALARHGRRRRVDKRLPKADVGGTRASGSDVPASARPGGAGRRGPLAPADGVVRAAILAARSPSAAVTARHATTKALRRSTWRMAGGRAATHRRGQRRRPRASGTSLGPARRRSPGRTTGSPRRRRVACAVAGDTLAGAGRRHCHLRSRNSLRRKVAAARHNCSCRRTPTASRLKTRRQVPHRRLPAGGLPVWRAKMQTQQQRTTQPPRPRPTHARWRRAECRRREGIVVVVGREEVGVAAELNQRRRGGEVGGGVGRRAGGVGRATRRQRRRQRRRRRREGAREAGEDRAGGGGGAERPSSVHGSSWSARSSAERATATVGGPGAQRVRRCRHGAVPCLEGAEAVARAASAEATAT